jgi:hypothetical protein
MQLACKCRNNYFLVVSLLKITGMKDAEFEGMYVGWTGVCKGTDISVIPCGNGENF